VKSVRRRIRLLGKSIPKETLRILSTDIINKYDVAIEYPRTVGHMTMVSHPEEPDLSTAAFQTFGMTE
jgi:hypothetical protein